MDKVARSLSTQLLVGTATPVVVARLSSIGGIELSRDTMEITALDSEGGYREYIGGFKDAGEVSLEGFLLLGEGKGQSELYDLFESGDVENFTIKFPPETKASWTFKGLVTGFGTSVSLDDPLSFSSTIKVSGKPSLVIEA